MGHEILVLYFAKISCMARTVRQFSEHPDILLLLLKLKLIYVSNTSRFFLICKIYIKEKLYLSNFIKFDPISFAYLHYLDLASNTTVKQVLELHYYQCCEEFQSNHSDNPNCL